MAGQSFAVLATAGTVLKIAKNSDQASPCAPLCLLACFAEPIKATIEDNPSFGYRTLAHLHGFNKNTVPLSVVFQ